MINKTPSKYSGTPNSRTARSYGEHSTDFDYSPLPKKNTLVDPKAKLLEEIHMLQNDIGLLEQIFKSPALSNSKSKPHRSTSASKPKKSAKKEQDFSLESDDDEIDRRPIYKNNNEIEKEIYEDFDVSSDEEEAGFDNNLAIAKNREKRGYTPSLRYSEFVQRKARSSSKRERQRETNQNPETSIKIRKRPVIPVPKWTPIKKAKVDPSTLPSTQQSMNSCKRVLADLFKDPRSELFRKPVNVKEFGCYDYYDIVKQPMDLATVQKLVLEKKIMNVEEFCQKVRLIWNNAILYNGSSSEVGRLAVDMSSFFENKMKPIIETEKDMFYQVMDESDIKQKIETLTKEYEKLHSEQEKLESQLNNTKVENNTAETNSSDLSPPIRLINANEPIPKIEYAEKCAIFNAVSGLQPIFFRGLYTLVLDEYDTKAMKVSGDDIEIDSDKASPKLLKRIQMYIKDCQDVLNKKDTPEQLKNSIDIKEKSISSEHSSSTSESSSSDSDDDDILNNNNNNFSSFTVSVFEEKQQVQQQQQEKEEEEGEQQQQELKQEEEQQQEQQEIQQTKQIIDQGTFNFAIRNPL